jgi:hypothetical protein
MNRRARRNHTPAFKAKPAVGSQRDTYFARGVPLHKDDWPRSSAGPFLV